MGRSTSFNANGSAFQNFLLWCLFELNHFILWPFIISFTGALSPFMPTTGEKQRPIWLLFQKIIKVPLYIVACALFFLPMSLGLVLRCLLLHIREPFCVSVKRSSKQRSKVCYSVVTTNVCLLPELGARFNNLNNSLYRAKEIADRIVADDFHYKGYMKSKIVKSPNFKNGHAVKGVSTHASTRHRKNHSKNSVDGTVDVFDHFVETDFLCVQETFDRHYAKVLVQQLHTVFPYIVFDVGHDKPKVNCWALNSGLMFASRYEILALDFKPFTKKCGYCKIISKGLLMAKVCLDGESSPRKVGYVFNTHLQAFQGDEPIVETQLSEIEVWTEEFRADTEEHGEQVMLDVLCGDFNIDNMSPAERHLTTHSLFNKYVDVCRERPGKDYNWTIGTELRTTLLHNPLVSTPAGLKQVLEDPILRQKFVMDADLEKATIDAIYNTQAKTDEQGNIIPSPVGGRRRIDLVLYRKDCPLVVENYSLVTRLAPLTDHIPVSMTFKVQP